MSSPIVERDLERFESLVARYLGLRFAERQRTILETALSARLAALGIDAASYFERVLTASNQREQDRLAPLLTVSETFFFRGREQLHICLDRLSAQLVRASQVNRSIRVLSAGCASGEEAHSLVILALDHYPELARRLEVIAADINPVALERARNGEYAKWSLRETDAGTVARWFTRRGAHWSLSGTIASRVRFVRCNLADPMDPFLVSNRFDAILCRNVLMYFTPERFSDTVGRLVGALTPGGLLFLGHAETLRGQDHALELCDAQGTFFHQKPAASNSSRPPPPSGYSPEPRTASTWYEQIEEASKRIDALSSAPELPPLANEMLPDLGHVLGLIEGEQFGAATAWLESLSPAQRRGSPVRRFEAAVLVHRGRLVEAEQHCTQLLGSEQDRADAHYLLAICSAARGREAAAVDHARAAAELDPGFALPHLHLGRLELARGNHARAQTELRAARTLLTAERQDRIQLLAAGFTRHSLLAMCDSELDRSRGKVVSVAPE